MEDGVRSIVISCELSVNVERLPGDRGAMSPREQCCSNLFSFNVLLDVSKPWPKERNADGELPANPDRGSANLLSQSGAGVRRYGRVQRAPRVDSGPFFGPGSSVGVAHEHAAIFIVARNPGTPAATVIGSNLIEAKDTNENHTDNWSSEKKGFPTRLKGNTLHVCLPALKTADVR